MIVVLNDCFVGVNYTIYAKPITVFISNSYLLTQNKIEINYMSFRFQTGIPSTCTGYTISGPKQWS